MPTRSLRIPPVSAREHPQVLPAEELATDDIASPAPPPPLRSPHICVLGSLKRDNETIEGLLKGLPSSEAGYHGSLRAILTTLDRMRTNVHGLLKAYTEDV